MCEDKLATLLSKIDDYRNRINDRRPLSPDELREVDNYYKIGNTYASNALEGNTLTLTETKVIIEDGITVGGKPIRDIYEAVGHAKAYEYMISIARSDDLMISTDMILKLHHLFFNAIDNDQAGKYRSRQVMITGTEYMPPKASAVPSLMNDFISDIEDKKKSLHPVLLAAYAHKGLVDVHPFIDGNGRTARLLMNLILLNKGYCVVSIPPVSRLDYLNALVASQRKLNPSINDFYMLIAECELTAQREYCRMLNIPLNHDRQEKPSIIDNLKKPIKASARKKINIHNESEL